MIKLPARRPWRVNSAYFIAMAALLGGCKHEGAEPPNDGPGEARDVFNTPVLPTSVTSLSDSAADWCAVPTVTTNSFVDLDRDTFVNRLADYSVSWMTPLHEVLLEIDEGKVMPAMFEMVAATFDKTCRYDDTWEFIPPEDELIDAQNQADVRQSIVDFFADAVVVEAGSTLRLAFHECTSCGEPLGAAPSYIDAQLTSDGVLLISVELTEGADWTETVIVTPDVVAVRAPLGPLATWGDTASADLRSGDLVLPDVEGTATAIVRKTQAGVITGSVGLSGLRVVTEAGTPDEARFQTSTDCVGFQVALGPRSGGSAVAARLGVVDADWAGSLHCPSESSCGEKERTGRFGYHLGDVSAILAQPPEASGQDVSLALGTGERSTASVAGDEFASGGLGADGDGGAVTTSVSSDDQSFVVTFEPALDMAGAMTISAFSDEMRLDLPSWLSDEIFDLTFGGDPVGSIRVPKRELCPEDVFPEPEVARREVRVETGGGAMSVGGGRVLEATAGQCIGQSLADPSTFTRISDFWEAGFTCSAP